KAAGNGNAELNAFKDDVKKQFETLTALVEKIAKSPAAASGAVVTGEHTTGESGKRGTGETAQRNRFNHKDGLEKSDVADQELRKALNNGVRAFVPQEN